MVVVLNGWVVSRWLAVQGCRGCLLGWSRVGKQWGDLRMRLVVACDLWSSLSAASCSPFALFFPFLSSFSRGLRLALGGRAHHKHTYIAHLTELRLAWLGGRSGELVAYGRTNGRFIVIFFPLFSPFPPFFFPFRISLLVLALSGFFFIACMLASFACLLAVLHFATVSVPPFCDDDLYTCQGSSKRGPAAHLASQSDFALYYYYHYCPYLYSTLTPCQRARHVSQTVGTVGR